LAHVSTGDLIRNDIMKGHPSLENLVKSGALIPSDKVMKMLSQRFESLDKDPSCAGVLVDGFPRTPDQLDLLINELHRKPSAAILLYIEENDMVQRILKRGEYSNRSDDTEQVAKDRIKKFKENEEGILRKLEKYGIRIIHIDGVGTPEQVYEKVHEAVLEILRPNEKGKE